jgi:hypothetical protein
MSVVVNRYRMWCETEAVHVYAWSEEKPVQCPNNAAHSIDADSIAIIEKVGDGQAYTIDGAAITAKSDQASISGNSVLLRRLDAEMAPEASVHKDWVIPSEKTWRVRLFSASAIAYEAEAKLEYFRRKTAPATTTTAPATTTTAPATTTTAPATTTAPPDAGFERVNPFDGDMDEPVAVLKLDGNSDSTTFYESLPFLGDGESFLRITLVNKDALDSVEASAYFNGFETDTPA